ncbi:hypothetical protein TNCV_1824911 [Trichonephila clavipes]|nr:hypothetical protein TNCV_1824911 [Trichonephila clavipes]
MRGGRSLTLPQGVLPQNWSEIELNRTVTSVLRKPCGYGRELVVGVVSVESRIRTQLPLKTCRAEKPMHIKSVETQSPQLGMAGSENLEWVVAQVSFSPLNMVQNCARLITNSSCVASKRVVNKPSNKI